MYVIVPGKCFFFFFFARAIFPRVLRARAPLGVKETPPRRAEGAAEKNRGLTPPAAMQYVGNRPCSVGKPHFFGARGKCFFFKNVLSTT
jgi:hypothetical protein